MKLKTALEIGESCGLTTIGEAILNIRFHAINIFAYGEEQKEYKELLDDFKTSGFNQDDIIKESLAKL